MGKDPRKLLRDQKMEQVSLLPPILQSIAAGTPTNMSSSMTPGDQEHRRNLSFEEPPIVVRGGVSYLNRLSKGAGSKQQAELH